MAVLSLEDAKAHLNVTSDAYDTELASFIPAVEAAIARLTGPLEPVEVSATVPGGPALILPTTPVISLNSVVDNVGGLLDLSVLWVTPAGVVSYSGASYWNGYYPGRYRYFPAGYYTVVWQAGRDVDADTNADLYLAIKEMLRHKWATQRGSRAGPAMMAMETVPGAAYSFPYAVSELIAPHIQVPV